MWKKASMKGSFDSNFRGVRIMRFFLAAILLCIVIGLYVVTWEPGPVERYFFPENYWEKRAAELERGIKVDNVLLADARIELDKRLMSADLDEEATIELSKELALDPSIGKKDIKARTQELIGEIRRLKDKVARWQTQLEEDRRLLRQARVELTKFRRQPK